MKNFLALLTICFCCSCATTDKDVLLSWGDNNIRYNQETEPQVLCGKAFRFPAWKGEGTTAQAVLWSNSDLKNIRVKVSGLRNGNGDRIDSENISVRFVRYVIGDVLDTAATHQCAKRPPHAFDSLLVADLLDIVTETDLAAGQCLPMWMKVKVPSDAAPGTYKGTLTVCGKGMSRKTLPIELSVIDRTLPQPEDWNFHLDLWQNPYSVARYHGVEAWSDEHFALMRPVMQILADAGQKVITTTIINRPWNGQTEDAFGSMIKKTKKTDGSWEYDYSIFDRWVEFMMDLGIDKQISCFSVVPWNMEFDYFDQETGIDKVLKADLSSTGYRLYWGNFISDFAAHLREKGWFDKTFIAMDERPMEDMVKALSILRGVEPDLKVSLAGNWHEELAYDLDDYCVTFTRPGFPEEVLKERRSRGMVSTLYTCCSETHPNTFMASDLAEAAWIPWLALSLDYDGYLRWAYNSWTKDPIKDARFRTWAAGDCYIVYPEGRGSLRMEKLTEGIQDYEKARILMAEWAEEGNTEKAAQLQDALKAFTVAQIEKEGAAPAILKAKSLLY